MIRLGGRYVPVRRGPRGIKGTPGVTTQAKDDGSLEIAPSGSDGSTPAAIAVPAPPVDGSLDWTENPDGTLSLRVTPANGLETP
jgi:hypothetical protein